MNAGNMIGGVESVLLTMAEFADTCPPLQQEFALAFDGTFAHSLRDLGATVHILPPVHLRNPLSLLRTRRALRQLLRSGKYDAVISHSTWCQVVYASTVAKAAIPLVFWMHNDFDGHWLQRIAAYYPPQFAICNSEFTRSSLSNVYPDVLNEVQYPVCCAPRNNASRNDDLRRQLGVPQNSVVILMASRMDSWKGHLNLLRAAAEIRTNTDWMIWIAGAPQTAAERAYFDLVQSTVQQWKLEERVRFLGHRNDIPDVLRACDIYCQPNEKPEPFGVIFIEAMQAGVPVVTYGMGGAREILNEETGLLVAPGDIAGLAAALANLIEDAPLRTKLGVAGIGRAESLCNPERQIGRVYETLLPLCQKKRMAHGNRA